MGAYTPLLVALLALLAGLALGKAWERYTSGDGKGVDGRRARESPHYILGLNALVANQMELATRELAGAASVDDDALDVHMILGNLYREQGQVGKAITVHQRLLELSTLSRLEQAHVLLCLGLDYERGGFVDRALQAFNDALRVDPENRHALASLEHLQEEQGQWDEAYNTQQRLAKLVANGEQPENQTILAFLENEIGLEALRRNNYPEASRRFEYAIDLDRRAVPAYLNLGDVRVAQGRDSDAATIWERLIDVAPDLAYLALDRLEGLAIRSSCPERFTRACCRLIERNPQEWRARLALSRHLASGACWLDAFDVLLAALVHNPHVLIIHDAIWRVLDRLNYPASLMTRYRKLAQDARHYVDPHVCTRCRYRSSELLWQCPHCRQWNTFVEERLAPSQDAA